jgi:hypothetical protein
MRFCGFLSKFLDRCYCNIVYRDLFHLFSNRPNLLSKGFPVQLWELETEWNTSYLKMEPVFPEISEEY